MKKKGFTLIELLAVIVILAIIALIAVPAVLNIIEDSRKGAAEASARNIVSAAKTYYMSETMNGRTVGSIDLSTNTLKYDGDQASKGSIIFTDGKPTAKMYISGYCVEVDINNDIISQKVDINNCHVNDMVAIEGTWKLNDVIDVTSVEYIGIKQNVNFSFNITYQDIDILVKCNKFEIMRAINAEDGTVVKETLSYYISSTEPDMGNNNTVDTAYSELYGWNTNYGDGIKTITFDGNQKVSKRFHDWLNANATRLQ